MCPLQRNWPSNWVDKVLGKRRIRKFDAEQFGGCVRIFFLVDDTEDIDPNIRYRKTKSFLHFTAASLFLSFLLLLSTTAQRFEGDDDGIRRVSLRSGRRWYRLRARSEECKERVSVLFFVTWSLRVVGTKVFSSWAREWDHVCERARLWRREQKRNDNNLLIPLALFAISTRNTTKHSLRS